MEMFSFFMSVDWVFQRTTRAAGSFALHEYLDDDAKGEGTAINPIPSAMRLDAPMLRQVRPVSTRSSVASRSNSDRSMPRRL